MNDFLESSTYIDWTHPDVQETARRLAESVAPTPAAIAQRCFEFVRDDIRHCSDGNDEVLTAKASEVLTARTGFCYAKSHLLAALLRANKLPAALCYQRLGNDNDGHTLHGLNAVYLDAIGWYRIDPRGNKPGVDAQFTPPVEQLAFQLAAGDEDLPGYWSKPAPNVISALTEPDCVSAAQERLPDNPGATPDS